MKSKNIILEMAHEHFYAEFIRPYQLGGDDELIREMLKLYPQLKLPQPKVKAVYRGVRGGKRINGLSWTTNVNVAAQFASDGGAMYELREPRKIIWAHHPTTSQFGAEQEFIIDARGQRPRKLKLSSEEILRLSEAGPKHDFQDQTSRAEDLEHANMWGEIAVESLAKAQKILLRSADEDSTWTEKFEALLDERFPEISGEGVLRAENKPEAAAALHAVIRVFGQGLAEAFVEAYEKA
jgi:hypothetical protein